ncbi:enoyl-CoA hydratase/isomerase family protein [Acidisphaera rubrifaciens]|uniref:Enoyl-CoA hydratase n=1 Tax=Acidisphaera rubrifaciens HS-AP3 TaxID=1231350 RepID=A0A0D6P5P5_9PROT|nr:enoyl-CoA hydratase-related protein [Acidisphaera rubrifaciens]GAN77100.1 enoyl-CoA hydratase [Acidisphaera rubrifaciens HS-AP3]
MDDMTHTADMLLETRHGAVAVLTMNYPQRRNAFAIPMRAAFIDALDRIEGDPSVRAIVLTGAAGMFSSGGDISGMGRKTVAEGRERFRQSHRVIRLLLQSSKPIIAAIEGWAAGAGLSLACCCDTVIAAEDAQFLCSFNKVGLLPDLGLLHTLPARVGMGHARQIMLYGETFGAARAHEIGLVDHIVAKGATLEAAMERAQRFADMAPLPIAMLRRYLAQGIEPALDLERDLQLSLFQSDDHAEGAAAFMEKRRPAFKGR